MALGRKLRATLEASGTSMNRLHLETRLSTSYLSKLMSDEFLPGKVNFDRICAGLVSLDVKDEFMKDFEREYKGNLRERELWAEIRMALDQIDEPAERAELITWMDSRVTEVLEASQR